jgi:NAD(P)-dependent dehydrogenase (short-subunit alcohol dehydrogenase family)
VNSARSFWVTGASNGLGLALVERLLEQGYRVAASGRECEALDTLGERFAQQLLHLPGQLQVLEQVDAASTVLLNTWGSVDCLIINAGTSDYLADDVPDDELFEAIASSNLVASEHCLTSALPLLTKGDAPQVMAILNRYSASQLFAPTQVASGFNSTAQWFREQRQVLDKLQISLTVVGSQSLKTPVTTAQAIPEAWTPESAAEELLRRLPQREPELVLETLDLSSLWPLRP